MAREGGLGKGLSSLIPRKKSSNQRDETKIINKEDNNKNISSETDAEISVSSFDMKKNDTIDLKNLVQYIEINKIEANPFQPRKSFDDNKLDELAASIKEHGIIQPLTVVEKAKGQFELIAGERRLKASQKSGLTKVPVIVRDITEKEKMEWALIENIQRHDLNAIEEAEAYQGLIDKLNYTQEEVAKQVGKNRSTVSNILRLLELSAILKQRIKLGEITEGHARALLRLDDKNKREVLASEIVKNQLSVRETERRIKKMINPVFGKMESINKGFEMQEFEDKASQALGTKVTIKKGGKGGKFILNYYSEEEFGNLFNKLVS